ncbi:GlsB/YeaQ/YmgE family stress response membrane protein [Marinicrinis sediminis]|uniref:GlsB/YeaQ/YmgE family stress response membrane protein n=1 Tax=Marinicrinis sediminis TaxID=1652465 RepID=A0ABW5RA42_9BACL
MLSLIASIILAIVIGVIGDALVKYKMPGGPVGSMIAGFAGAWMGTWLLGTWGPIIGQFAIIPAIIGAALFVLMLGIMSRMLHSIT